MLCAAFAKREQNVEKMKKTKKEIACTAHEDASCEIIPEKICRYKLNYPLTTEKCAHSLNIACSGSQHRAKTKPTEADTFKSTGDTFMMWLMFVYLVHTSYCVWIICWAVPIRAPRTAYAFINKNNNNNKEAHCLQSRPIFVSSTDINS